MSGVILSAVPADDPVNRAHAMRLGGVPDPWPVPYRDSVLMDCYACGGRAWVGPEVQKARTRAVDAGDDPPVLCLLCVAVLTAIQGTTTVVTLTGKGPGE